MGAGPRVGGASRPLCGPERGRQVALRRFLRGAGGEALPGPRRRYSSCTAGHEVHGCCVRPIACTRKPRACPCITHMHTWAQTRAAHGHAGFLTQTPALA